MGSADTPSHSSLPVRHFTASNHSTIRIDTGSRISTASYGHGDSRSMANGNFDLFATVLSFLSCPYPPCSVLLSSSPVDDLSTENGYLDDNLKSSPQPFRFHRASLGPSLQPFDVSVELLTLPAWPRTTHAPPGTFSSDTWLLQTPAITTSLTTPSGCRYQPPRQTFRPFQPALAPLSPPLPSPNCISSQPSPCIFDFTLLTLTRCSSPASPTLSAVLGRPPWGIPLAVAVENRLCGVNERTRNDYVEGIFTRFRDGKRIYPVLEGCTRAAGPPPQSRE